MDVYDPEAQITVLVVEPEPVTRAGVTKLLSDAGFAVIEATRTHEAWATLAALPAISVLVTDLDDPNGTDRLELARRVHERWPSLGLVITSRRIRHLAPSDIPVNSCFLPRPLPVDTLLHEVRVAAHQIAE